MPWKSKVSNFKPEPRPDCVLPESRWKLASSNEIRWQPVIEHGVRNSSPFCPRKSRNIQSFNLGNSARIVDVLLPELFCAWYVLKSLWTKRNKLWARTILAKSASMAKSLQGVFVAGGFERRLWNFSPQALLRDLKPCVRFVDAIILNHQ